MGRILPVARNACKILHNFEMHSFITIQSKVVLLPSEVMSCRFAITTVTFPTQPIKNNTVVCPLPKLEELG